MADDKPMALEFPTHWSEVLQQYALIEGPPEDRRIVEFPVRVTLPEGIVDDYTLIARDLGWTLGQVVSYLAVQGIVRMVERAEEKAA